MLSGRLSVGVQSWLGDHVVYGAVVFPGTGFVELVVRAGEEVGCGRVEELVIEVPLVLPERGGVRVQVVLEKAEGVGSGSERWGVEVFSLREDAVEGEPWTRHVVGVVGPDRGMAAGVDLSVWPPVGAEVVGVEGFYEGAVEAGLAYGPAFRGLRGVWRRGEEVFAEVELSGGGVGSGGFGVHPALLDGALHAVGVGGVGGVPVGVSVLPFSWSGVVVRGLGSGVLRVRLVGVAGGGVSLWAVDGDGVPVVSVERLSLRAVSAEQIGRAGSSVRDEALFGVEWTSAVGLPAVSGAGRWVVVGGGAVSGDVVDALLAAGAGVEVAAGWAEAAGFAGLADEAGAGRTVVLCCASQGVSEADSLAGVWSLVEVLRAWLGDGRWEGSRLVVVTRGAVAAGVGESVVDVGGAALWGLVRSAQSENPGRLTLVDLDEGGSSAELLVRAVASGEDQVAVRGGELCVPRLVRVPVPDFQPDSGSGPDSGPGSGVWGSGSVLVTGGTGGLGALVARHLVVSHGVRDLVLVSRRGLGAPGAGGLKAELEALGAVVEVVGCDVSDREAVTGLLAGRRLSGVVHAAGVLRDGVVSSLSREQVEEVLAAKARSALLLDALTAGMGLSAFVMFSSAAGVLGAAGQGNYAAANAVLDAVAVRRRSAGLAGLSLAWGLWEQESLSEMTAGLGAGDRQRIARAGMVPLAPAEGLELFDVALSVRERAVLVPARWNAAVLRARAVEGELAPVLHGLVPASAHRPARSEVPVAVSAGGAAGLRERLVGLGQSEARSVLTDLVRSHAATVLGHTTPDAV
ncbi:type I polyketide synthase, partial [Streptomyces ipomoeae]|uniref:type I polyketide synthase n=1 Tax=Streptomyces ipomoeae TaxID=103232 RepID=UPI00215BAAD1